MHVGCRSHRIGVFQGHSQDCVLYLSGQVGPVSPDRFEAYYIDLSIDSRANTRDKDEDDDGTADLPPSLEQVLEELTIDVKTRRGALPGMEAAERDKFLLGRIAALEKMEKNLAKLQDNLRAVHQDYDRIAEEYKVNQIGRNLQLRLNEDIVE